MKKILLFLFFVLALMSSCRQLGKEGAEVIASKAGSKAITSKVGKEGAEILASKAVKEEAETLASKAVKEGSIVTEQLEIKWIANCKKIARTQTVNAMVNSILNDQQLQQIAEQAVSNTFTQCLHETVPNQAKIVELATTLVNEINREKSQTAANSKIAEQSAQLPLGNFSDGTWLVTLNYQSDIYYYTGTNLSSGKAINLSGGQAMKLSTGNIYSWKNEDYSYNVAWNPAVPNTIRLQVVDPNNKEILNSFLSK